ncbi:oocyte zinc finger protein XlCOF26 isoform X2 [Esox lucius]|uniref:C2H2-type domain-containing protein n=2 Tax=Esox lucius TaxID=8010 RepID=A0A3P8XW07_ESOLU|nr:oocyte zinc finger protein XlCOF26 isoform X2 [Esox lucius]XP_010864794.2 oocyte zinc finger protein XlCOF26 isoform X2 [Esox lucius]
MELGVLDIEQVILGEDVMTSSTTSIKSQTVPAPQPYQHDSLQCFQCFITFCNPKSKERHMRKSHREEYNQSLQQTNTLFTCYVCDRTFPTSEELTQHQASHSLEDKPFRCPHCQTSFRTFSELTIHRRTLCKERQFVCKDCGMVFRGPNQLRTHRLSQHSHPLEEEDDDTKTHRCGKCRRGFETEVELVMHQENFAGEQHCDGKLKKRGRPAKKVTESEGESANGEKRVHPKEILQIPCPEAECDLTFSSVALLRAHKKEKHGRPPPTRKAHSCSECEESYARPEQLNAHKARAHSSGRHNCPTCGKSFGRESNLKAHLKVHTEDEEATDDEKR